MPPPPTPLHPHPHLFGPAARLMEQLYMEITLSWWSVCAKPSWRQLQTTAVQSHWSIKCRSARVSSLSSSPTNNHHLNPPKNFKNLHLPLSAQEERLQFIGCNPGCARRCFAAMLVAVKFCEELQETIKGRRHHRRHSGSLESFQGLSETLLQRCCVGRTETY